MELRILGPLEVLDDTGSVSLGGDKQRGVLAALALRAPTVITVDEFIETLWPQEVPRSARKNLQTYVWSLRRAFAAAGCGKQPIEAYAHGYRLRLSAAEFDWLRFRDLVAAAESSLAREPSRARAPLRDALALWRGPVVADVAAILGSSLRPYITHVEETFWQAVDQYADLELEFGGYEDLISVLRTYLAAAPLRERLYGKLMLALYRSGRRAEALDTYRRLQAVLAAELGVGPGDQLRDLWEHIRDADQAPLAQYPARRAGGPVVPRQLPPATPLFVGRAGELRELTQMADRLDASASATAVAVVEGAAGVGKTTLTVHWAHQVAERFSDGQLYVDLRGFGPSRHAVTTADVVWDFLDALGVSADGIPHRHEARIALYRSILSSRRMLILLDNARDAAQVAELTPGGSECMVVVTSRTRLDSLIVTAGAHVIRLEPPPETEARQLLARRLEPGRIAREPDAAQDILRLCARLPLALSIVAARISAYPTLTLAGMAAQLHDRHGRLNALEADDAQASVRSVLSWSYRWLSDLATRTFQLLSLHPGPDISIHAAAGLVGVPAASIRTALAELVRAHLLIELVPDRYAYHDLVRIDAYEQALRRYGSAQRYAAVQRVLDHYVNTAHTAALLLDPTRDPLPLLRSETDAAPENLVDQRQALLWCEAERRVLLAAITSADEHGFDRHVWQLAWALVDFFDRNGHWRDLTVTHEMALAATQRSGDSHGEARIRRGLGRACVMNRAFDAAYDHFSRALAIYEDLGDREGAARIHRDLSWLFDKRSRFGEALEHARYALEILRELGHRRGMADLLNTVGWCHARLGECVPALDSCAAALELMREFGDRHGEADTWDSLGYIRHLLGEHDRALACYERALRLYRETRDRYYEADTLVRVGDAHCAMGDFRAVRGAWSAALRLFDDLGHTDAEHLRSRLAALPAEDPTR